MKDRVWHYMDKSKWVKGPWTEEPDKMQFTDTATQYPCLIARNFSGALCGYVGVSFGHPDYERHYNDMDIDVHGGLTFCDFCQPNNKEHGICHIVEPGEDDRIWWFGFDCCHSFDVAPDLPSIAHFVDCTYKNFQYVQAELRSLAAQLKEREK